MTSQFIVGGVQKLKKNFLTFDKIYKNCKVFKLEQNYRSTKNILETASNLISIILIEWVKNYGRLQIMVN